MSLKNYAVNLGKKAKRASRQLAQVSSEEKNQALLQMARQLEMQKELILTENKRDFEMAQKAGLSSALLDRIALNPF